MGGAGPAGEGANQVGFVGVGFVGAARRVTCGSFRAAPDTGGRMWCDIRGADGLAKRAPYGGDDRQRLSSQSIKAHLRGDATGMAKFAASIGEAKSVRSAMIAHSHTSSRRLPS